MGSANLTMGVKGVDKTGAAFNSIKARAKVTGLQVRSMLGGALAAAGAYLGLRSIKGGIDELGHLSDIAMKTSTSVDELTQTTNALGALGIQNMGVDQLGKAFDYMAKTTGRSGMEGFYKTIDEIGKIPDVALRGQEAMRIFGRSGMELMPLINGADESVNALRTVVAAMPKVSQAAANAGDGASDALGFAANEAKRIWLEGLGFLANKLNNDYTGDVRTAALTAGNSLTYWTKTAVAKCLTWFQKLQNGIKAFSDTLMTFGGAAFEKLFGSGGSWSDVFKLTAEAWDQNWSEFGEESAKLEAVEEERTRRFKAAYEDRALAVMHFAQAYDKAAISIRGRKKLDDALFGSSSPKRISNELLMGGSNAVTKLQILGPTLQSESKKQTRLLEKIANNTEKTADNTDSKSGDDFYMVYA